MPLLFLLFILVPFIEIWGILTVGSWIGAMPTLLLIVLTALAGSFLLKREGIQTLTRAKSKLNAGQIPMHEMLEGILLAVAGALLLTPGFFTDFVGLFLLLPPGRSLIIRELSKRMVVAQMGTSGATSYRVVEGEFSREE
jgi:UPF0716 protein FxsA|tara:strand:+ start:149185 stop:149604 length:420 start_codon:yes stop_codon:yes gene_type:complete